MLQTGSELQFSFGSADKAQACRVNTNMDECISYLAPCNKLPQTLQLKTTNIYHLMDSVGHKLCSDFSEASV